MTVGPPLRIFVVENDTDSRDMFSMLLESLGHEVSSASSIEQALLGLTKSPFDLLISDIGLADGSGWDLMRQLNLGNVPQPPYAVAMSGYGMAEDRRKSQAAGFMHHFVKPMDLDLIEKLLDDVAGLINATRERPS